MQDLSSRKILMAQAMQKVFEIEGITLLHFRLQGVDYRKKLVSRDIIYTDFPFPLVRVLMAYQCGNKGPVIVQSRLIYPNNVYPYGRKTLEVLEDIAHQRYGYVEGASWKVLGDIFYEKYDFSVENLKRAIIRVNIAFNRLLAVGLTQALNIVEWRFGYRKREDEDEGEGEGEIVFSFFFPFSFFLFSFKCIISGIRYQVSGIRYKVSGNKKYIDSGKWFFYGSQIIFHFWPQDT